MYALAKKYQVPGLETPTKDEISRLGDQINLPTLVDVVEEAYPRTMSNDTWMIEFIQRRTEAGRVQ